MRGDFLPSGLSGHRCERVSLPSRAAAFWNTVYHDRLPDEELLNMIDHAYEQVLHSFSREGAEGAGNGAFGNRGRGMFGFGKKAKVKKRTETIHNGAGEPVW